MGCRWGLSGWYSKGKGVGGAPLTAFGARCDFREGAAIRAWEEEERRWARNCRGQKWSGDLRIRQAGIRPERASADAIVGAAGDHSAPLEAKPEQTSALYLALELAAVLEDDHRSAETEWRGRQRVAETDPRRAVATRAAGASSAGAR